MRRSWNAFFQYACVLTAAAWLSFGLLAAEAAAQTREDAQGRRIATLNNDWRFFKGEAFDASAAEFETKGWLGVTLPHTYNSGDGADGGGYYRGTGWYRRTVNLTAEQASSRLFLQFDGAALTTDVWVNSRRIGRHEGGHAAFRFDITAAAKPGVNTIAVRVDNKANDVISPLGGDFTVFGGLYRGVSLISTPAVHIDTLDYGGPGVYAVTSSLGADSAEILVSTKIRNAGAGAAATRVSTRIVDASGQTVASATSTLRIPAGALSTAPVKLTIKSPRLWNGVKDPYLYRVISQVTGSASGAATDQVAVPLGVRTIKIDPAKGLLLNDQPVSVHGVNLHLDRPGKGLAVSDDDIAEDFRIIREMGSTGVRLVHFQHPQRAYEIANETGLMLWTEIGLNGRVSADPGFAPNMAQQLRELIRQNYNHPSVVVWGLGNEVYATDDTSNGVIAGLQTIAREEDPSRSTAYASCCFSDTDRQTMHTDVIAYNRYYGWYPDKGETIGGWADGLRAKIPNRAFGVSEYGAGASILHQQDPAIRPETTAGFHPEHYQALYHETNWRQLRERPFIWSNFIWVAFDFASDGRNEGDRPGINDKGLGTHDRQTQKDAYYWYQANWTEAPMVYIAHRRFTKRTTPTVAVKVYSNQAEATLTVNGAAVGATPVNDHIATWTDVALRPGVNVIEVAAGEGANRRVDRVEWTYDQTEMVLTPLAAAKPAN